MAGTGKVSFWSETSWSMTSGNGVDANGIEAAFEQFVNKLIEVLEVPPG